MERAYEEVARDAALLNAGPETAARAVEQDSIYGSKAPKFRGVERALLIMTNFFTFCMVLFLFLQPIESWLLNDVLGQGAKLCVTPAKDITCGSGENYTKIALSLNRINDDGQLYGCGCEEGILGDWACAAGRPSFSVSLFISTAPGTGAMAALSAWPIIGMWRFGAGTYEGPHKDLVVYTLCLFQFCFGLFLINTVCIAPTFHTIFVYGFLGACIVHYSVIAFSVGWNTFSSKVMCTAMAIGIIAIIIGNIYPDSGTWLGQHIFWLGECIGLSAGMLIVPILTMFPHHNFEGIKPNKK